MQDHSTKFQGGCTRFEVVSCFDKTKTHEEAGEEVPTDLKGELTESQLRKSENLAKRRLQKALTKSKTKKRHCAEPCESDTFSENATTENRGEKQNYNATLCTTVL